MRKLEIYLKSVDLKYHNMETRIKRSREHTSAMALQSPLIQSSLKKQPLNPLDPDILGSASNYPHSQMPGNLKWVIFFFRIHALFPILQC